MQDKFEENIYFELDISCKKKVGANRKIIRFPAEIRDAKDFSIMDLIFILGRFCSCE